MNERNRYSPGDRSALHRVSRTGFGMLVIAISAIVLTILLIS